MHINISLIFLSYIGFKIITSYVTANDYFYIKQLPTEPFLATVI